MILKVQPPKLLQGRIFLPASKSYSIRAFIVAACGGKSKIIGPSNSDDVKVSVSVAKALGAKIKCSKNKKLWNIDGGLNKSSFGKINVQESGTVLRFLLPLLSFHFKKASVVGRGTLKGRPNKHLIVSLRRMGMDIKGNGIAESIPIVYKGGHLHGGDISVDGSLSSQFISALLISSPRIERDTRLSIKGKKMVSSDYIIMTEKVLKKSGIQLKRISSKEMKIKGGQKFKGFKNFTIPSDYGLAAFFMAAASLVSSDITLDGFFDNKMIQADGAIISLLKKMGVRIRINSGSLIIKGPFKLKGGQYSLKNCPDLVPIISVLALFAKGSTRIYDIAHVRAKESDRISDLKRELLKIGAKIKEKHNEIIIYPQKNYKNNVSLNPHHDHRLAMSFCVLGLRLGAKVKDIECVRKSYPDFVRDFRKIGAKTYS